MVQTETAAASENITVSAGSVFGPAGTIRESKGRMCVRIERGNWFL